MARSSSGLGHRPLKAEITGSNPVRATKTPGQRLKSLAFFFACETKAFTVSGLSRRSSIALGTPWKYDEYT